MNYTNLNVKSHYSLLNSTLKIDDIISFSLNNKMKYVSLCDESYLCGAIELINKATKNNLIPIVGLDFKLDINNTIYHFTAFALNHNGFKNLEKLSSSLLLNDNNLVYEDVKDYFNNIQLINILDQSYIYQQYLLSDEISEDYFNNLLHLFSNLAFSFNYNNDQTFYHTLLKDIPNLLMLPNNASYYQNEEDSILHYLINCLRDSHKADEMLIKPKSNNMLFNQSQAMLRYHKDELVNLDTLLSKIKPYQIVSQSTLPLYKEDINHTNEYLIQLCYKGLDKRLNKQRNETYLSRLNFELEVVVKMGYANYFLVVYDYVLFAKKSGILVGPGRGSSAGSLIAYCLGITDVDPIKNNLLFERFLNPERISLPDIDVDFQDDAREDIINYLKDKYGYDQVAHIITFGTFQAKNSIRDLGKVLNYPSYRSDLILKLIPNVLNVRLVNLINESKQLQVLLNSNEDLKRLYELAIKAENLVRHISTHAAGIVIVDQDLRNYVPVLKGINNTLMVQYPMNILEQLGIYKMDILGLKNLSILKDILNNIENKFNLNNIPLNDSKTLNLMSNGNTLGIFQFESPGVIKVLKKMHVDHINDLVATTALFRPGPMQYIDEYIKRKNKQTTFSYLHPDLKEVLEDTYGIIIYQEQIMKITQIMAGFSLAKADIVRKGMAKKDEKLLIEIKKEFISNAINLGYDIDIATKVYDMILLFSNYGFNKAHAYSYALLGYYLAYLKANYPAAFFKSILSANIYSVSKLKQYFYEMKNYDLKISSPHLNYSTLVFEYQEEAFIIPFTSIKGIGESSALLLIEERKNKGIFTDYQDTIVRLLKIKFPIQLIHSLIYAGAFDIFEYSRNTMVNNIEPLVSYLKVLQGNDDQTYLDIDFIKKPKVVLYADNKYLSIKEYESIGLYINNHPLDEYQAQYQDRTLGNINDYKQALCLIEDIKQIRTKKGELMAFVRVSDYFDNKTLVCFPKTYHPLQDKLKSGLIILVDGHLDEKDEENIIVNRIKIINN